MNTQRFNKFMLGLGIWYVWCLIFHAIAPMYAAVMDEWLTLDVELHAFLRKPWALFSYVLIPTGSFISTLFSMLFLYFCGRMLFDLVGDRHLGISLVIGMALPSVIAVLLFSWWSPAMGFRLAGITLYTTTILAAAITYMPRMPVHLFGIIRIPLYVIGLIHVASSIISIPHITHILLILISGGLGYAMVRHLQGAIRFSFKVADNKQSVVRKHPSSIRYDEDELNRILDKIRDKGVGALSADEKAFLDRFSS